MAYDANDPADKKIVEGLIKAALAEAQEEHEQDVQGLKAKNNELLGKIKKLEKGENNAEEMARLEKELEENKVQLKEANKQLKNTTKELETAKTSLETETTFNKSLLVDNGLTDALTKANVATPYIPAVKALLASKVEIATVDGARIAKIDNKSLGDYIKEWSQGDDGKHYVSAPANSGTGARGANNNQFPAGTKTMSRADYEANPAAFGTFFKEGGKLVD